ncbi:MAG: hypothetical protein HY859_09590 [Caulobacterales bacterium]|nr:hypothetical protein [Caulobacterales bacterium]
MIVLAHQRAGGGRMDIPKKGAALARVAKFFRAEAGPPGMVVLALATPEGIDPYMLTIDDAATAAVRVLQVASSDPDDPVAYPADEVIAQVADDGTIVLRFRLGGGYLPLSLEPSVAAALKAALDGAPEVDRDPSRTPRRDH